MTKVRLVPVNNAIELNKLFTAAKTCYSAKSPIDIFDEEKDLVEVEDFVNGKIEVGHVSVIEHTHLTFLIEGVSRALTHQLVRHRLCNYSQQSQRYVKLDRIENWNESGEYFVIPPSILNNDAALKEYSHLMKEASDCYKRLVLLGIRSEDARFVLGNGCQTNIVMTVNLRELIHICNERLCSAAQWEIRNLVSEMKKCVVEQLPFMDEWLQPKCVSLGYCPESEKRSCGRMPLKKNVILTLEKQNA